MRLVTWKTWVQVQGLLRLQSEFSEPLSHNRSKGGWECRPWQVVGGSSCTQKTLPSVPNIKGKKEIPLPANKDSKTMDFMECVAGAMGQ